MKMYFGSCPRLAGWQGGTLVPSGMLCLPAGSSQDLVRLWELCGTVSIQVQHPRSQGC